MSGFADVDDAHPVRTVFSWIGGDRSDFGEIIGWRPHLRNTKSAISGGYT